MHEDVPTKAIAACFGLCGFIAAIILGMLIDNPTDTIITRAIICLIAGWITGYFIGSFATRTIGEAIIKTAETAQAAAIQKAQAAQAAQAAAATTATPTEVKRAA